MRASRAVAHNRGETTGCGAALGPRVHGKRPGLTQRDREEDRRSEALSHLFPLVAKAGS